MSAARRMDAGNIQFQILSSMTYDADNMRLPLRGINRPVPWTR